MIKIKNNVDDIIKYSPSVLFNNRIDSSKQDEIKSDTIGFLCRNLYYEKLTENEICQKIQINDIYN